MTFIHELLEFIATAGGIMPKYKAYQGRSRVKYVTFHSSLKRLERRGLIKKISNHKQGEHFAVTHRGRQLLQQRKPPIKRVDGLATLIGFDIPEEKRRARNSLRRFLQQRGFTMIQKSLFVSPDKVDEELLELLKKLQIKPYVKIMSGKFDYL